MKEKADPTTQVKNVPVHLIDHTYDNRTNPSPIWHKHLTKLPGFERCVGIEAYRDPIEQDFQEGHIYFLHAAKKSCRDKWNEFYMARSRKRTILIHVTGNGEPKSLPEPPNQSAGIYVLRFLPAEIAERMASCEDARKLFEWIKCQLPAQA